MKENKKETPTFKTIDRDDAVADSENTLSCECDKVSRLNSLCREEKRKKKQIKSTRMNLITLEILI